MNIRTFDLNLLIVFEALYAERSVTRAGERLGLTQPAISNALIRLRKLCNDPLFVRTPAGMSPTALAEQLAPAILDGLETIKDGLEQPFGFNAATSERRFRLLMSDVAQVTVLPGLMALLCDIAPGVTVQVLQRYRELYRPALESGEADLAVGNLPDLAGGFYQQFLFEDRYVCLSRKGDRRFDGGMTRNLYLASNHGAVTNGIADTLIDAELETMGLKRKVVMEIPSFLAVNLIANHSDVLVSTPLCVAETLGILDQVRVFEVPLSLPRARIRQFWHRRNHADPANQWLRRQLSHLFQSKQMAGSQDGEPSDP